MKSKSNKRSGAPLTVEAAMSRAIKLQHAACYAEAATLYRSVLARRPGHVDAMHLLGVAEHRLGRNAQGLEWLDKALRAGADHPELHNHRGNVLMTLERLDEAEAAYERALALRPGDPAALSNLGAVAQRRGQFARAEALLLDAITLAPNHYEAYQHLASVLKRLERLPEALLIQEQALRVRPTYGDAFLKLGATYCAVGRIDDAAELYRRWSAIDPEHPVPRHLLAGCTGEAVPARASDDFLRASFDTFSGHFDAALTALHYRAPELVGQAVTAALGAPAATLDVLDAGAGTGLCAQYVRPYARKLVAVDLSEGMLQQARARAVYDELVVAELGAFLAQTQASYDLIVCADTLIYFGALEHVCSGFASALRSGGHVVFTTEHAAEADAPHGYRLHTHGRYSHSEPYVRRVVNDAGLVIPDLQQIEVRLEAGKGAAGLLVTARKP